MKTATRQVAVEERARSWVEAYKRSNPEARRWASGSGRIRHSVETQERVFRMAEQLRHRRAWPADKPVFRVLEALADFAEGETDAAHEHVRPVIAAAAGIVAHRTIFGEPVAVSAHGWPRDVELAEEGEADLVIYGLRARGFDPIVFDGTDPSAYTWALFEVGERRVAGGEAARAYVHSCPQSCALAIVPPMEGALSNDIREPAGVGV